jgi:hypothetical protein
MSIVRKIEFVDSLDCVRLEPLAWTHTISRWPSLGNNVVFVIELDLCEVSERRVFVPDYALRPGT